MEGRKRWPLAGPYCLQLARELTLPFTNSQALESGSSSCLGSRADPMTLLTEGQVNQSQNMSLRHLSLPLFYMVAWVGERCPCPVSVYSWGGWESWPWGQRSRRAVPALTSCSTRESKPCIFPGPHNGANTVGKVLEPTPRLWVPKSCLHYLPVSAEGWAGVRSHPFTSSPSISVTDMEADPPFPAAALRNVGCLLTQTAQHSWPCWQRLVWLNFRVWERKS